jgi:hypothetical protein
VLRAGDVRREMERDIMEMKFAFNGSEMVVDVDISSWSDADRSWCLKWGPLEVSAEAPSGAGLVARKADGQVVLSGRELAAILGADHPAVILAEEKRVGWARGCKAAGIVHAAIAEEKNEFWRRACS